MLFNRKCCPQNGPLSIIINAASYNCETLQVNFNYTISNYTGDGVVIINGPGSQQLGPAVNGAHDAVFDWILNDGNYGFALSIASELGETQVAVSNSWPFEVLCCADSEGPSIVINSADYDCNLQLQFTYTAYCTVGPSGINYKLLDSEMNEITAYYTGGDGDTGHHTMSINFGYPLPAGTYYIVAELHGPEYDTIVAEPFEFELPCPPPSIVINSVSYECSELNFNYTISNLRAAQTLTATIPGFGSQTVGAAANGTFSASIPAALANGNYDLVLGVDEEVANTLPAGFEVDVCCPPSSIVLTDVNFEDQTISFEIVNVYSIGGSVIQLQYFEFDNVWYPLWDIDLSGLGSAPYTTTMTFTMPLPDLINIGFNHRLVGNNACSQNIISNELIAT